MINWKRNLAALWLAEFTAIFGFSFAFPFLPVFLSKDLGIHGDRALAFWTGIAASATGFSLAIASPVWGRLADRYGRKPMLVRAMLGGGVTVGLMGLSQSALQLTGLRLLQGAASGTVAAATALVASETPRLEVGWSLGILSSAIALGSAVGPAAGGVAGSIFGLRAVFITGGVMLLVATLPVLLAVRESPVRPGPRTTRRALELLRTHRPGTLRALGVLIGGQALLQSGFSAGQQLVVLRFLQFDPGAASTVAGIAFGAGGIASALAGISYSRAVRVGGYRNVTVVTALLLASAMAATALLPGLVPVIGAFVVGSFLYGALIPALTSMIGLEAPGELQATVYGFSASAVAVGFGLGPLTGGLVAAAAGVRTALLLAAAVALVPAGILRLWGREPVAATTSPE